VALLGGSSTTEGAPATTAPADQPASDKPAPEESAKPKEAKIGEPVKDGELRFVVSGVKCGATRVGDQYFGAKAQGQSAWSR
jgi:hypothetical protein